LIVRDKFFVPEAQEDKEHVYRWCNTDERAMLMRIDQGYVVCKFDSPELPAELKPDIVPAAGGVARRRGTDLILCKISKRAFEENIESKRRDARERHAGAIDNMVAAAKENAERAVRAAGLSPSSSGPLVFKDTAGPFKS
jgi:hypothetical protein